MHESKVEELQEREKKFLMCLLFICESYKKERKKKIFLKRVYCLCKNKEKKPLDVSVFIMRFAINNTLCATCLYLSHDYMTIILLFTYTNIVSIILV